MQDVYTHFQERIPINSSGFSLPNPNTFRDGIDRMYRFEYLEIVPEYFSILATENELENENINPTITRNSIRFECGFTEKFYGETNQLEINLSKGEQKLSSFLSELNKFTDENKNPAYLFPPLVVDWVNNKILTLRDNANLLTYLHRDAELFYKTKPEVDEDGEETENEVTTFVEKTHTNVLPVSTKNMPFVNTFLFPDDDISFLNTRVRFIIAPNTRLSFSNLLLLNLLGFTSKAYGEKRGEKNRYHIVNTSPDKRMEVIAENPPVDQILNIIGTTNVYISLANSFVSFTREYLSTKYKESKVTTLIFNELNNLFKKVSRDCYIQFGILYDAAVKRFKFVFSDNPTFGSRIVLSSGLQKMLGYNSNVINHSNTVSNNIDPTKADITKFLNLCKILTQDTCDVIVTLANVPSLLNRGQTEQIVAALLPKDDILKKVKTVSPYFRVPENDQDVVFKIYRHSEGGRGKVISLGWPIGCYIYGMICGKPIKTIQN